MNIPLGTRAPDGLGLEGSVFTLRQVKLPVLGVGRAGGSQDARGGGLYELCRVEEAIQAVGSSDSNGE